MLAATDFSKKQIIFFSPAKGDKLSYQNDNLVIKDHEGVTKYQQTCHRIFMLVIVGDATITTGLLRRAKKFGFAICLMSLGYKVYSVIASPMEGNTLLHQKQYAYEGMDLGRLITKNKLINQKAALKRIRKVTPEIKEGIDLLDGYIALLDTSGLTREELMGIEGNAARVYFARIFNNVRWKGRKPRIKYDYVNCLLDIGYNLLFNFLDAVTQVFGFDTYQGVLHTCFYMRKSLICDLMEPFRPIIDYRVRTGINLKEFKEEDFIEVKGQWQLEYKQSSKYVAELMEEILEYKDQIFLYVRNYYRAFMKGKPISGYNMFLLETGKVDEWEAHSVTGEL